MCFEQDLLYRRHDRRCRTDRNRRCPEGFAVRLQMGPPGSRRFQLKRAASLNDGIFRHDDFGDKVISTQRAIGTGTRYRSPRHQLHAITELDDVFRLELEVACKLGGHQPCILPNDHLSRKGNIGRCPRAGARRHTTGLCIDKAGSIDGIGNNGINAASRNASIFPDQAQAAAVDRMADRGTGASNGTKGTRRDAAVRLSAIGGRNFQQTPNRHISKGAGRAIAKTGCYPAAGTGRAGGCGT